MALNDLCTTNQRRPIPGGVFILPIAGRRADVSYFRRRPYDLKPLEHGFDLVVHLKTLRCGSAREKAAVGGQPPFAGGRAFPFIPSLLIDIANGFLPQSAAPPGHICEAPIGWRPQP